MNVFNLRDALVHDYSHYVRSFIRVKDDRIKATVDKEIDGGLLWPEPLIQLNPSFQPGGTIDGLVDEGVLHTECGKVFRVKKEETGGAGNQLRLYRHQEQAIRKAREGRNYVLTTGTGSGKSMAYIVPIVDHVLRTGSGKGIKAIVVYPMNALANSQRKELEKFLVHGYGPGARPVTFERYTGQESREDRDRIIANPPDILLTNFVMLELILTRLYERQLIKAAQSLQFLVLDELHTYRGRQGSDVAMLVRRMREYTGAVDMQCVGTSATIAGEGNHEEQQAEISGVASTIFGASIEPEDIIGETLQRSTNWQDESDEGYRVALTRRLQDSGQTPPTDHASFQADPLASWVETAFGTTKHADTGRFVRSTPKSVLGRPPAEEGAADHLAALTGVDKMQCASAIRETLMAGNACQKNPDSPEDTPVFAFRLHQFISRGDNVYATVEAEDDREVTVFGKRFAADGDEAPRRALLPLCFCRECGQEYYVTRRQTGQTGGDQFAPRPLGDRYSGQDEGAAGFLYVSQSNPWPDEDPERMVERLPDDWIDPDRTFGVRRDRRKWLPERVYVGADGSETASGQTCWWVPAPFRFCLACGVSYAFTLQSDVTKLESLGAGGRSTATTILALKTVLEMREQLGEDAGGSIPAKLLSFTDNRQDASLQAGHFNDFIQVGLLRGAVYRAAKASADGVRQDELTQKVFEALALDPEEYAQAPDAQFAAKQQTDRAFRQVLGYRLYHDLRRGWRVNAPNLEQCGLLRIEYESLQELCEARDQWVGLHPALAEASVETRVRVATALLDHMRRELAINVEFLDQLRQEQIEQMSNQRLAEPWAVETGEPLERSRTAYPRMRKQYDHALVLRISSRSGYARYLRSAGVLPGTKLNAKASQEVIVDLLSALAVAGIVDVVKKATDEDDVPGYQVQAAAMIWKAGDGETPYQDPVRIVAASSEQARVNEFFRDFYRDVAQNLTAIEAREHTAQVRAEDREKREDDFRKNDLPILFCSPTMELGVDIAELNVVNMRNVPPTPANYAQRSGRAGRGGQPALVFSYCTSGSPHDQYFFKRPEQMVSGQVVPPRLDLTNEDLIRSHVHAVWLTESGIYLEDSLSKLLDLGEPSLPLIQSLTDDLQNQAYLDSAKERSRSILASIQSTLDDADWHAEGWLEETVKHIPVRFQRACERWRSLYISARDQQERQNNIVVDASRGSHDKDRARALRREAESQLRLLTESSGSTYQSDFYSYRYFASEGFLPGYNFPRLPLSAFIPGRQRMRGRDEFLSRPRFLAISEFGPRAIIYHEGAQYRIEKAIIPAQERDTEQQGVITRSAKLCPECGYLHPMEDDVGPDVCRRCDHALDAAMRSLFRLQNVGTRRIERITSDEEERVRIGYELQTAFQFSQSGDERARTAQVKTDGEVIAELAYGHAAMLWRVNLGWRRRKEKSLPGFNLDLERGYWDKKEIVDSEEGSDNPDISDRTQRVIPYVEDHRNCLIFQPHVALDVGQMASLQAALKNAIQIRYQLEDGELAAEPLPTEDKRNAILLYEAAEGGAGVLRRLIDDSTALPSVAREALELVHFDPDTGDDLRQSHGMTEECVAACYDCLMSYRNQRDHQFLDRHAIRDVLMQLAQADVEAAPGARTRPEHLRSLLGQCGSELEKKWLRWLDDRDAHLPTRAQVYLNEGNTRPDFLYDDDFLVVYVDGPAHQYPERQARDAQQQEWLEDAGYSVVRFTTEDDADWSAVIAQFPNVFGA
jgi:superfamily II DNA/RNA helicase/very-short-patch-repair endonuclease